MPSLCATVVMRGSEDTFAQQRGKDVGPSNDAGIPRTVASANTSRPETGRPLACFAVIDTAAGSP